MQSTAFCGAFGSKTPRYTTISAAYFSIHIALLQLFCYRTKVKQRGVGIMYEQNKVSVVGRIVWFIVSVLLLAALVWLVLWLLFWRNANEDTVIDTAKQAGSSAVQSGSSAIEKAIKSDSSTASTGSTSTSSTSTSSTAASTATNTATTGSTATNTTTQPSSAASSQTTPTTGQTSSTSTTTPSAELANTGSGDLVMPVAFAVAGGAVFYHVRLRRKELQE